MAITDWPLDDRPREKLLNKGAETLSDAELVAIFLRTGVRGRSAVDVAREALARFGSLSGVFAAGGGGGGGGGGCADRGVRPRRREIRAAAGGAGNGAARPAREARPRHRAELAANGAR